MKYEEHETYKIKNTIYSLFNYLTKEQEEYIDKLCSQLQEFKNEFFYKIYYYLEDNNYYELGNNQQKNILMELNNLRKNSKIKFKQINDNLSIHFENNFQNLIDFIQKGKIDNALNQIIIIDNIKNEIKNLMKELEFIQNHHYSNCSNIIKLQNKTKFHKNHINKKYNILKIEYNKLNKKRYHTPINLRNNSFKIDPTFKGNNCKNKRSQLSYSYVKPIHNDISYENNTFYINNSKEEKNKYNLLKEYRNKIKEKNSEIECLRELLLREKEYKNIMFKEFNNLKYNNKNSDGNLKNTMSILHLNTLSSKLNKLSEMVMNFSNSLRHFHDTVYKNSNNNFEIKNIYQKLVKKLELIVDLNFEAKQIENKMKKRETKMIELNKTLKNLLDDSNEGIKLNSANLSNNISKNLNNEENNNISFRNNNIEIYNGNNLTNSKEKLNNNKNNNILQKLMNENKNLKSQIASLVLSQDSKNSLKNVTDENLKEEIEQLKRDIEEKNIIIEILKNTEGNNEINDTNNNIQNKENNTKRSLNKDELKKEVQFLNYQFESMENVKRIKNIFKKIEENNLEEENMKLEIENKNLKKEIESNNVINIKKELEEKIEKLNLFIIKNQNEINELNSTIILLKSNIGKLKQENTILIESNQKYLNKKTKFKISSFNLTINPDLEIIMIKTESSIQKEEINILKKKNQELIDVNKSLYEITQELKININKEKNDLIHLIKNAFEKFIYETKIDNKNKEFLLILLKTLDYSDDEINFILSIINGKKKSKMVNFFSG